LWAIIGLFLGIKYFLHALHTVQAATANSVDRSCEIISEKDFLPMNDKAFYKTALFLVFFSILVNQPFMGPFAKSLGYK